jgi:hypothetical protein
LADTVYEAVPLHGEGLAESRAQVRVAELSPDEKSKLAAVLFVGSFGPLVMERLGGLVSICSVSGSEVEVCVPFVTEAVIAWLPSPRALVGVKVHAPDESTVAVPSIVVPSVMVTVAPGAAVPRRVGVMMLVRLSPGVPLSLPGASSIVGFVNCPTSIVIPPGPPAGALVLPPTVCVISNV